MSQLSRLSTLFKFESARSKGIDDYSPGIVPFVSSTVLNNGVVGYVTPFLGDKVFTGPVLCISGLGDATVQTGRFLPKGNGGDSLTIGKPINPMTVQELIAEAAAFNTLHGWRFSYGRKASRTRLENLELPTSLPEVQSVWTAERARAERMAKEVSEL